jgi:proteic killer suppression protein
MADLNLTVCAPPLGAAVVEQADSAPVSYRYSVYDIIMPILSFKCIDTRNLHERRRVARFANVETVARRKLDQLHAAAELRDLASPPGNRLEALSGNRKGQHSIRINDQWRLCMVWTDQGPEDVEIVDYH